MLNLINTNGNLKNHSLKIMKLFNACSLLAAFLTISASGQTLVQTFEAGEDTSNWGANWVAPGGFTQNAAGFLDSSLGGSQAGSGSTSLGQEASRNFRNNTVGLDVDTDSYSVSMYLKLVLDGSGPASGHFFVLDGAFGDYTGNIRISYDASGALSGLEAADGSDWDALNVTLDASSPYQIQFTVDPIAKTYSTTVSEVDASGAVLSSDTLNNLAITGNAINNHQNGQLVIHADTSAGTVGFEVDDISIQSAAAPEPASMAVFALGTTVMLIVIKRRRSCRS